MSSTDLTFYQHHKPTLPSGEYRIQVEQTIYSHAHDSQTHDGRIPLTTFSQTADFAVYAERFALNPQEIQSVFPPPLSLGDHSHCFPHILLRRSTLPWERSASKVAPKNKQGPWLALLLFHVNEAPELQTQPLKTLRNPSAQTTNDSCFPDLSLESAQKDDDAINFIDVQTDLLKQLLPNTLDELALLTHVRQVTHEQGSEEEFAVVVGNRLPATTGMSVVHLVSIENRYTKEGLLDTQNKPTMRLVSLKNWRFSCIAPDHTFEGILKNLDQTPSTLRLGDLDDTDQPAQTYIQQGYIPLQHHLRQGQKTFSWYHSPLSPGQRQDQAPSLPAQTADELVRYNPDNGLFDVTYAAAWELGRLLTLQNKAVSIDLFNWKRAQTQTWKAKEQIILHLPIQQKLTGGYGLPASVQQWLNDLRRLKHLPFQYLVPQETMLPIESIRFFQLDTLWVQCLLDGAFSLGRVTPTDLKHDAHHLLQGHLNPTEQQDGALSGFLLRSELVSGWPHLHIHGYDTNSPDENAPGLPIVRMERLSKNLLFCLFAGSIQAADFYQKPERIHFGIDPTTDRKQLRKTDGSLSQEFIPVPWQDKTLNVIDIQTFAKTIGQKQTPATDTLTSSQFALAMIEGSPKVRYILS